MRIITSKTILTFCCLVVTAVVALPQSDPAHAKSRYPNELPTLQLYASATWRPIVPYVSTRNDVERILGAPSPIYDQRFYVKKYDDYLVGYDHDPDWVIIVSYIAAGGSEPSSLVGRVSNINLYPRRRISLQSVEFPKAFTRSIYEDNKTESTVYYDSFGLKYSIYSKVSVGDGHEIGDLRVVEYGVSDEDEARVVRP